MSKNLSDFYIENLPEVKNVCLIVMFLGIKKKALMVKSTSCGAYLLECLDAQKKILRFQRF